MASPTGPTLSIASSTSSTLSDSPTSDAPILTKEDPADTSAAAKEATGKELAVIARATGKIEPKIKPKLTAPLTIVRINVASSLNNSKQTYLMHKEFACFWSPMLDAAFNSIMIEGQTQAIDLVVPCDPKIFGVVQGWMYTETLQIAGTLLNIEAIMATWILADQLLIPALQNMAMKVLTSLKVDKWTVGLGCWVYDNTSSDSKLRTFLINKYAFEFDSTSFIDCATEGLIRRDFFIDVARVWREEGEDLRKKLGWRPQTAKYDDYKVSEVKL